MKKIFVIVILLLIVFFIFQIDKIASKYGQGIWHESHEIYSGLEISVSNSVQFTYSDDYEYHNFLISSRNQCGFNIDGVEQNFDIDRILSYCSENSRLLIKISTEEDEKICFLFKNWESIIDKSPEIVNCSNQGNYICNNEINLYAPPIFIKHWKLANYILIGILVILVLLRISIYIIKNW